MCAYLAHQRSFIVTLAWIMGKPLTLLFDPFQSIVLFLSGTSPLPILRFVTLDAVCSAYGQLHHPRRQVELARRDDLDVYVVMTSTGYSWY